MSKGSTWSVWDFHLHTPFSVLNNQFGNPAEDETWRKYIDQVEALAAANGVVAIALTDYFMIDGYKRALEFQKAGRLANLFLLPGIEFRIDKVLYRAAAGGDPKRLNMHVIFSPEISADDIEESFLHELHFIYQNEPFDPTKTRTLKVANLTGFGEMLRAQHEPFRDYPALEVGCRNAVVQGEEIKKNLENRFRGKYLLILADDDLGLISWDGQDHATRKSLVQMSHAVFSGNQKTRAFCLGQTHDSLDAYLEEFKSPKPCVWGCDSHAYTERFLQPDQKRFCWIKGEVTWEGLKQVLYEPEERVRIQERSPEPAKSIYTLDSIQWGRTKINNALAIDALTLDLNPNLVTIIGGRGSGKTALLDLIAACFHEGAKLDEMENSFYYRLFGTDPKRRVPNEPIPVRLTFRSGEQFAKQVGTEETTFEKADIIYLTQNHFDEYSSNPEKLNEHIIALVFDRFPDEKRQFDGMEHEIDELGQTIRTKNVEIENLRSEISGQKDVEENELKNKEGERVDCLQRLEDIERTEGKRDDAIQKLTETLNDLRQRKRVIESLLHRFPKFKTAVESFSAQYVSTITDFNQDLALLKDPQLEMFPVMLGDLGTVGGLIESNFKAIEQISTKADGAIQNIDKEIQDLAGVNKIVADLRQQEGQISAEIRDIENRIKDIIAKQRRIAALDESRFDLYLAIVKQTIAQRLYLQSIIDRFGTGKDEMLANLSFSANINMSKGNEFIQTLAEKVDNRRMSEDDLRDEFQPIFDNLRIVLNGNDPNPDLTPVVEPLQELARKLKLKRAVTDSEYYGALLRKFYEIGLEIKFGDKVLGELSMGERAIVLLKILLALDDKPLLIDQPEEHLDNRYIYSELVPAFRNAKAKRQIIIATHNANLVVNTDAEQIIVAEHINGVLFYKAGTLEDLSIRDKITTILEGGDKAFEKREQKYGYRF